MAEICSAPGEYRVAIYSRIDNPYELSDVLQRELKLHPSDALIWAHHLPGILNKTFSAEQARALVAALDEIGIRGSVIPAVDIPDLHRATVVHHACCTEKGLEIVQLHSDEDILVPWSAIELICVGEVPVDTSRHYSTGMWSGVSAGHHYQLPGISVPGAPSLEVWIACRPPLPIFVIDHGRMNYEYLGARRVDSATANFKQFIADLTEHAMNATLTESTTAYIGHVHPERYRFQSRDDFVHHVTLQTLMTRQPVLPTVVGDVKP